MTVADGLQFPISKSVRTMWRKNLRILIIICVLALTWGQFSVAAESKSRLTLLVVHPTSHFDLSSSAKDGINAIRSLFHKPERPTFTLYDGSNPALYYLSDIKDVELVFSAIGEHEVRPTQGDVVMTGGYFRSCFRRAFAHLLKDVKPLARRELNIYLPMEAIYFDGELNLAQAQAALSDEAFVSLVGNSLELKDPISVNSMGLPARLVIDTMLKYGNLDRLMPKTVSEDLSFLIFRNGREIDRIGDGPIKISLHFVSLTELKARID